MIVQADRDMTAIGVLAGRLGQSVRAIEAAAESLSISPALRINDIVHFDGEQVERLTEALREGKAG